MVTDPTNNGANDDSQQQQRQEQQQKPLLQQYLLQPSHPIDVRMKRHPELQPFVPLDRERILAFKGPTRTVTNATKTNDAKSPSKPKRCVSMSRLNQLAQPKRVLNRNPITTTSTLPSSSLSSSTTTNSSLRSNKNYTQAKKMTSPGNQILKPAPALSIKAELEQSTDSNSMRKLSQVSVTNELDNSSSTQISENPTNGINYSDKSFGSLVSEIEAGFSSFAPKLSKADEERRMRAEEELQEVARKELEEREKRSSLVDSILSKISQSS